MLDGWFLPPQFTDSEMQQLSGTTEVVLRKASDENQSEKEFIPQHLNW